MHVTRPKSSKGRSRPAAVNTGPDPAVVHGSGSNPDRNLRSQSEPSMRQEEVLLSLQSSAAAAPLSLNKYKVLPSIARRRSDGGETGGGVQSLYTNMSLLTISGHNVPDLVNAQMNNSTANGKSSGGSPLTLSKEEPPEPSKHSGAIDSLLLAVRAPCGRRLEQHFNPTDTLLMVRVSAEDRFGHRYEDAFIQTLDVPRRSYTDLDMTLAQCGIKNRSVLCITLSGNGVDQD